MRRIRWLQALVTFAAVVVGSIAASHSARVGYAGSVAIADHAYESESVESSSTDTAPGGNGAEQRFLQGAWPWTSPTHAYDHPAALGPSSVPHVSGFFAPQTVLSTPSVGSTKLQNIIDDLYKGTTNPGRVGTGTTADAIRYELRTGQQVFGRSHIQKGEDYLRGLENWLKANPNASYNERLIARSLADDLLDALGRAP